MLPVLKYVRGEHLSQEHWLNMFRLLGLPRGTTLEKLTFGDLLSVANTIGEKALELKVCVCGQIVTICILSNLFFSRSKRLSLFPHSIV